MADDRWAAWAWEGDKAALVDIEVGEVDECLVLATVMPIEITRPDVWDHHIQQALETFGCASFFVGREFLFIACGEEGGWRQLLVVPCDHYPLAAQNSWNRIFGQHLAGLIENDEIEILLTAIQQLADRERAGHPARTYCCQHLGRLREHLS